MNLSKVTLGAVLICALLSPSLNGQDTTESENLRQYNEVIENSDAKIIPWPAAPRSRLRAELKEVIFDNIPMTKTTLTGNNITFVSEPFPDWVVAENIPPRYSILFEHRNFPLYKWGISVFRHGEFMSDEYATDHFIGYAKSILQQATEGTRILFATNFNRWGTDDFLEYYFSGGTIYYMKWYEIKPNENSVTVHFQYFIINEDQLVIYTVMGPEKDFDSFFERAKYLFTYLERQYQ